VQNNNKYLAFSTDGGTVGVVDLSTQQISRMKVAHNSICGSVKFIPDRTNEIISAGYDSAILHFDFMQRSVLSRFDITAAPPTTGVSLSPPFILSLSVSPTGLVAAGTADGRLWIGSGGDKTAPHNSGKKKRSRKWEGLREADGLFIQVAEGPVVAVAFDSDESVVTCTLLGKLAKYAVSYTDDDTLEAELVWDEQTTRVVKVNAIAVNNSWLVVGGFSQDKKGAVELYSTSSPH